VRIGVIAIFCAVALVIAGLYRFSGRAYSATPTPTLFVTEGMDSAVMAYPASINGDIFPLLPAPSGLASPQFAAVDASGKLYVTNERSDAGWYGDDSITIYAKGSNVPSAIIGGKNTGLNFPEGIAVDSSGRIYVVNCPDCSPWSNGSGDYVTVYAKGSNGNVAPIATIGGSNTGLNYPEGIAVDSTGNIYVADEFLDEVFVFPALGKSTGTLNEPPTAFFWSAPMITPVGIALDSSKNIYVADYGAQSVFVFEPLATLLSDPNYPDPTPIATISGSKTALGGPFGIALDSGGNIYVADEGSDSVTVYPTMAKLLSDSDYPNVTPIATISGSNTGLASPQGIALDPSSSDIEVANSPANYSGSGGSASVTVYPPLASLPSQPGYPDVTPSATISGSNLGTWSGPGVSGSFNGPNGVAVDPSGKIYVTGTSITGGKQVGSVSVYAAGSNAEGAPIATISGSNTDLNTPQGVAVDSSGAIYVADTGAVSVFVYSPLAGKTGLLNEAPVATISGGNTGLGLPEGITLDSAGYIYVADDGDGAAKDGSQSVFVYPPLASLPSQPGYPDVTPTATINGSNTDLSWPEGIAMDPNGYIYVADSGDQMCDGDQAVFVYEPLAGLLTDSKAPNVLPVATIKGSSTGLCSPYGIALESSGSICVADQGSNSLIFNFINENTWSGVPIPGSVFVFEPLATLLKDPNSPNVTPSATLSGPDTELYAPQYIAIQPTPAPTPIAEKLTISPHSIAFGKTVTVKTTSKPKTVTIKNAGSKKTGLAVKIESESASPAAFAVTSECAQTLEPGNSCKVSVTFTPANTTAQTGSLQISDNVVGEPQSVGLSGTGKDPK
jgi:sugar lactone lactonase YvrE